MRTVSRRWKALVGHVNQWDTTIEWSNDGGRRWHPATYVSGSCTQSALSQSRWACDLVLADVEPSLDAINGYSTQLRILHGLQGERLLPMGRYKVTNPAWTSERRQLVSVKGESFECYLRPAEFTTMRNFAAQPGMQLVQQLIWEVLPGAQIDWRLDNDEVPKVSGVLDRWGLIDGDRNSASVARALGGQIFAGPAGDWVCAPTPSLDDDTVWEAREGDGGTLLSHGEDLSDEGVCNVMVVTGQSSGYGFRAGIAEDLDPTSPTYVRRPVTKGGFGRRVKRYGSSLVTSHDKAQRAAQAMLAPYLGLRQRISGSFAHDPSLEPGDVGTVHTAKGPRRVLLDEVTYDLRGGAMSGQTRTTVTRYGGEVIAVPDDSFDDAA